MDNNLNIGERISDLVIHFADGVNTRFALLVGTSEANIRNYRNGKMPKYDFIYSICTKFEINYEWLLTGKGEMLKSEKIESQDILSEPSTEYSISKQVDYKEKYINELEEQVKLLKVFNQSLQKELSEKSAIIKGFLDGAIEKVS